MKVLSLFDWISCWMLALERVWIKVDKYHYMMMWPITAEQKIDYVLQNAFIPTE